MPDYIVLKKPYTKKQLRSLADKDGWITGVVKMDLEDFIDNDLEGVLDILSELLTDNPLLMGIEWKVVGFEAASVLHIEVRGDTSEILGKNAE